MGLIQVIIPDAYEVELDWYFRIILIASFFLIAIIMWQKARSEQDLKSRRTYFQCLSFFNLFTGLNFLLTEINLYMSVVLRVPTWFYDPLTFEEKESFFLGRPAAADIYLFIFFFLAIVPWAYAMEKIILQKPKPVLTYLGLIGVILCIGYLVIPGSIVPNIAFLYSYGMMAIISLRILWVFFFNLGIKGVGQLKTMGFLMSIGFFMVLIGTLGTSLFGIGMEWLGHLICLIGVIMIFNGTIRMK